MEKWWCNRNFGVKTETVLVSDVALKVEKSLFFFYYYHKNVINENVLTRCGWFWCAAHAIFICIIKSVNKWRKKRVISFPKKAEYCAAQRWGQWGEKKCCLEHLLSLVLPIFKRWNDWQLQFFQLVHLQSRCERIIIRNSLDFTFMV